MTHPLHPEAGGDLVVYVASDLVGILRPGPRGPRRVLIVHPERHTPGELAERLCDSLLAFHPIRVVVSWGHRLDPESELARALSDVVERWEGEHHLRLHFLPDIRLLAAALRLGGESGTQPPAPPGAPAPQPRPTPVRNRARRTQRIQLSLFPWYGLPAPAPVAA